ncbi:acetyl-CoA carboxylase biotin carboxyl carrier protein [Clostridium neuense]|uniref:Acetyl-CoA carboxylase biotin carboxyl carrier protein n=1 Tax=Clostridium neuense TaxID=1728934 RepID=A0ABW8TDF3_9CLOT
MDENNFLKIIELIINSGASYAELKTDSLYIKALKGSNDKQSFNKIKIGDEICCTKERSDIMQIKSLYVGVINIFNRKTNDVYVKIGSKVKQGQILGIIMFLKIPIDIVSPAKGIVTEVLVKNNEMVEYGQVLFKIKI